MSLKLPAFLLACFFAVPVAPAHGQGVQVGPDGVKLIGFGKIDVETTLRRWASDEERRIKTHLELQIDLLRQPCELTEAQVEKLRLLSAGIVSRKLSAGRAQLKKFMIESGLIPGDLDATPAPADKLTVTGARMDDGQEGVVLFRTQFKQPLFDHPLWRGVLKTALSQSQFVAYKHHCRKRNERFVDAAVNTAVTDLDGRICLTPAQRAEITKAWRARLMPHVTVSSPSDLDEATKMAEPTIADRMLVEPLLTASQLAALDAANEAQKWGGVGWTNR